MISTVLICGQTQASSRNPKHGKGTPLNRKKEALNTYITKSLNTIDPSKDVVDMVQVGNETTGGFIGETNVSNMCVLFSAGATGVENVQSGCQSRHPCGKPTQREPW